MDKEVSLLTVKHDFPDIFKCGSHNEEPNVCGCWILAQK